MFKLFREVLPSALDASADTLFARLGGEEPDVVVANGIGFLLQAYDATAGLIGNTLVAPEAHPDVRTQVKHDPGLLGEVIGEVLRCDPPVQNTRRFVAQAGTVARQMMDADEAILVILAAANRDPAANPDPARFDVFRTGRKTFTFGVGVHACPGEPLARTIAQAGIAQLLDVEPAGPVTYLPSFNLRMALAPSDVRPVPRA